MTFFLNCKNLFLCFFTFIFLGQQIFASGKGDNISISSPKAILGGAKATSTSKESLPFPPNFQKVFVLPVVHIKNVKQTKRVVALCKEAGAPGVFLIGHYMPAQKVLKIFEQVRIDFPDYWIGLNLQGISPQEAFRILPKGVRVDGLWTDNAMVDNTIATKIPQIRKSSKREQSNLLYFGGVAFKGQAGVLDSDLVSVTQKAATLMEVVTTSGPATGIAADLQKIANMSKAANAVEKTPLAIASGVDHKNIKDYIKAGARFFLVASSIKKGFNGLDPIKLKELLAVAQNQETLLTEEDPSLYASSFNKIIKKMSLLANHDSKESRASVSKATPVLAPLKNKNRRVIAIGDIHGNLEELKILWSNLINTLGEDELNHSTLVFLGDYCDRGPNTKGVFDWLIELKKARVENPTFGKAYFIAGNHDFAMAAFLGALPVNEQPSPAFLNETAPAKGSKIDQVWKFKLTQGMHYQGRRWGGLTNYNSKSTFQSYGISTGFKAKKKHRSEFIEAVPQAHKDFLAKIPWIHEEKVSWKPGRLLFVHAGLLPDRPAEEQITALGSRDLSNTVIHESGQPWRFASFSNRKEVLEPHPDLIGKALIISGHHGFTSLSNESQIILDASGGRPSKSNPLQALILPEKIIVDSNK